MPSAGDLAAAKRFRQDYGLRADEAWIQRVAADPASAAGIARYGVPLLPTEVSDLDGREQALEPIKTVVIAYGVGHPEDFAGAWIDQVHGGILVAQFSAHIDQHRQALFSQVSPKAPLEVRQVRWSLRILNAQAQRIRGEDPWFKTIPALVLAWGVDEPTDKVYIRISSVESNATRLIEEHFGWLGLVFVDSDGTGAQLLPVGTLAVTVRDSQGRPVPHVLCLAIPDMPGAYEPGTDVPTTNAAGICRLQLPATGYWIRIETRTSPTKELAIARAVVVARRTGALAIKVAAR